MRSSPRWIAFWLYWLVASATTKATQSRSTSGVGIRIAIFVLILSSIRSGVFKGHGRTIHNPWLEGIGLAVLLLGLGLAVWARIYLGRNWGTPMSQKVDPELVTTGPYHYVRHPIYSGNHRGRHRHRHGHQRLLAAGGRLVRCVFHLQRHGGGTHHGAPVPRHVSRLQARHQDVGPVRLRTVALPRRAGTFDDQTLACELGSVLDDHARPMHISSVDPSPHVT
jgi:hypothetical protein